MVNGFITIIRVYSYLGPSSIVTLCLPSIPAVLFLFIGGSPLPSWLFLVTFRVAHRHTVAPLLKRMSLLPFNP